MKVLNKILSSPIIPYIFLFGIIAYIMKMVKGGFGSPKKDVDDKLSVLGSTITDLQAKSYADVLYQAMIYLWGTDEKKIYDTFEKIKNQADFNKVYNEFGVRRYSEVLGNEGLPISPYWDLIYWLNNELIETEKQQLNNISPWITIF